MSYGFVDEYWIIVHKPDSELGSLRQSLISDLWTLKQASRNQEAQAVAVGFELKGCNELIVVAVEVSWICRIFLYQLKRGT